MKAVLLSAVLLGITIATSSHADQQTGPRRHDSITAEPPEEQEREAGEKHGGYRLICKTQIKALEGDAVVLPSILYPPLNLTTRTLDVRRRDLRPPDHDVVHSYRDGGDHLAPQMIRYRNRTSLSHSQLTGGILELQISSVNPSDSGPYTFYVSKPVKASCVTNLTVVSTDQQTRPRRHDSITTKPPEEREPGPGEKHGADWKHVVSGVVGGVAVAVGVVVLLLRKLGVICMKEDRVI